MYFVKSLVFNYRFYREYTGSACIMKKGGIGPEGLPIPPSLILLKECACYSNMSLPNCSGRWKLGPSHLMGFHDRKCGVGSSSPHL